MPAPRYLTYYVVRWDNGHACGELPTWHRNPDDAQAEGENWLAGIIADDDDPEEAREAYSFEVVPEVVEPDDE